MRLQIECGGDLQAAALRHAVAAQARIERLLHVLHEVGRQVDGLIGFRIELDELREDRVGLRVGQILVAHQHVEHDALPCFGRGEVREEVEIGRPLRDTGEQRRFGLCQIGGVLAEIDLAGRLRPVCPMAVVEQVEVHLQQLVLAKEVGQLLRQPGFEHFAVHGLVIALIRPHEEVAGELHGDGAGAGSDFAFLRVA